MGDGGGGSGDGGGGRQCVATSDNHDTMPVKQQLLKFVFTLLVANFVPKLSKYSSGHIGIWGWREGDGNGEKGKKSEGVGKLHTATSHK